MRKMKALTICIITLGKVIFSECTDRPIIGIVSQEFQPPRPNYYPATNYIGASYVKAVEASGARVVPIFINRKFSYYKHLLHSINGVVMPGGSAFLQPKNGYYDAVTKIYAIAKKMNDKGIVFPILAVCLGFEALLIATNDHVDMQTSCSVIHENYPLVFAKNFRRTLTYANLPQELYTYFRYFDVTKNNHEWCTTVENFTACSLDREWLITSTNVNSRGLQFVSSVEHKRYPFVGVQFHPEKYYEWNAKQNNPHSRAAIKANRYFYDLVVDLAKRNFNVFSTTAEERETLIYNYAARIDDKGVFEQFYAFV